MFFPEQYYTMIVFGRDIDIYVGNPFSFFFLPLLTVHIKKKYPPKSLYIFVYRNMLLRDTCCIEWYYQPFRLLANDMEKLYG